MASNTHRPQSKGSSQRRIDENLMMPITSILTPSSGRSVSHNLNKSDQNIMRSSSAVSLMKDKEFFRINAIKSIADVEGREKSLVALHKTYKNIDKAE